MHVVSRRNRGPHLPDTLDKSAACSPESTFAPLSRSSIPSVSAPTRKELNILVAAQQGDVSGKASATDRDDQNITTLHWAAINTQLVTGRYLVDQGAEVDTLGGD
ncbi:uncharacterized protein BXZ73DRAFT_50120 [Epithele typhae]|uniref:uncharacterized protein n=1 Tax=Epithele typhae TaxID=378194 RepID=UPI0020089CB0|nr:uncharacterized protein BXZ73DRAFT_50120 [Epithele typhae]KAH9924955.1 hypothetical protein BXZ73DRAFT_50120 [Epithele typhae]